MPSAISLYSGGLDSILAILILRKQQVLITALKFINGFVSKIKEQDYALAEKFGFKIEEIDIREKFIKILKQPQYGYGKNLNPCIDCKILMLKEAKRIMDDRKTDFIITGEVLGQRTMTQRENIMKLIEKEAGLTGFVLRPLSAKLLPPTLPEIKGLVNRELLYDFQGRNRKPQLELARQFGIEKIPQPAGGCLLTDPLFCRKLKDLLIHNSLTVDNIELLKIGRHFRISDICKAVVGRDEKENYILLNNFKGVFIYPSDKKGPVILLNGECSNNDVSIVCCICVYYSKRKTAEVIVKYGTTEKRKIFDAISEEEIVKYRI